MSKLDFFMCNRLRRQRLVLSVMVCVRIDYQTFFVPRTCTLIYQICFAPITFRLYSYFKKDCHSQIVDTGTEMNFGYSHNE